VIDGQFGQRHGGRGPSGGRAAVALVVKKRERRGRPALAQGERQVVEPERGQLSTPASGSGSGSARRWMGSVFCSTRRKS